MRTNHEFQPDPEPNQSQLIVLLGSHVEVELIDSHRSAEQLSFDIVEDRFADLKRGYLGQSTPLAKTILGKKVGDEIPYSQGDLQFVRVLDISPALSAPPEQIAEQRKETIRKAVEQSDRTNAMIFASSFSGKWGDYDPGGIDGWENETEQNPDG